MCMCLCVLGLYLALHGQKGVLAISVKSFVSQNLHTSPPRKVLRVKFKSLICWWWLKLLIQGRSLFHSENSALKSNFKYLRKVTLALLSGKNRTATIVWNITGRSNITSSNPWFHLRKWGSENEPCTTVLRGEETTFWLEIDERKVSVQEALLAEAALASLCAKKRRRVPAESKWPSTLENSNLISELCDAKWGLGG